MPKKYNRAIQVGGEQRIVGTPSIDIREYDKDGMVVRAFGATVPTDADAGYAVGCLFVDTDGGAATTVYMNEGTTSSCDFNAVSSSAGGATAALNNLASVAINTSLISDADDTDDLGSSAKQWKDLYIDGVAYIDELEADVAELGGATNYIKVASAGVLTMEGTATVDGVASGNLVDKSAAEVITGGWDFTTAAVEIKADDLKLGFGTAGINDSYILFDGTSLIFYDTEVGSTKSLNDLLTGTSLNPSVNGDLTISDGKFNWTDAVNEIAATWSFAHAGAGSDIDIASSVDSGECIHIVANSLTTGQVLDIETDSIGAAGALIYLDITAAGHDATGNFIQCFNGAADVFEVGKYGAVTIAGNATGTDAITVTAGDITLTSGDATLTDGDYVITKGKVTVSTVDDETSNIIRNKDTASSAVLELEATHTGDTGVLLLLDHNGTGASSVVTLDHEGTADCITITSKATTASLIKATGEIATGTILEAITAASATVSAITVSNSGTGATGWLGADGVGMLNLTCDGNLAHANASCLNITYSGTGAASGMGTSLRIVDSGATSTSFAVYISAATGEALKVDTGEVLVDEFVTATEGIVTAYDGSVDLVATPTAANFDTCFGATAKGKAGFVGVAKDSGGTPVYIVTTDGTDWWYTAGLTKAT